MAYIYQYNQQYSNNNFTEKDILNIVKNYEIDELKKWLKEAAPDKNRATIAFNACLRNDWTVGMDLIIASGWSKEKKLINDGWNELLGINLHEKNKEGSVAEQWLIAKTFNNRTLYTKTNLNKLSIELAQFANSAGSSHYWKLFRPHISNLKNYDGALFFRMIYLEYVSKLPHANQSLTFEKHKALCLSNINEILNQPICIEGTKIWDILYRDKNEELFFKIIESTLLISSKELMSLAIYVPMYYKLYEQNIKKVDTNIIQEKLKRVYTALKQLKLAEFEDYTIADLTQHDTLTRQHNQQYFVVGTFDVWKPTQVHEALHLPATNITQGSIRIYAADCFFAEPNKQNEYEPLTEQQKCEYRQRTV